MSEPDIDQYFFLLENPIRRRLLELLSREELYPLQLARELGISPTGIMKHLNLLEGAGLVGSRPEASPQGPPRKLYATRAGFAIRVAVGPNTFEQRIVRLTGDSSLPLIREDGKGLVRMAPRRPGRERIKVTLKEGEDSSGEGDMEVLGPEEADGSGAGSGAGAVEPGRSREGSSPETLSHEALKKRIRVTVTEARQLDPRSRLSLFAHVSDEMEKALGDNIQRHKELLELKRLVQGEVAHMARETGCTYDERKVLYCRLDHPTAPVSQLAELTDLREGIIRKLEARLRARHLLDQE